MNEIAFLELQIKLSISPMDLMQYKKQNPTDYIVVDVRNAPPHLKKTKIAGAIDIPLTVLAENLDKLPKDKLIIVYCWDVWCHMGKKASIMLLKEGYDVKELSGGISAWNELNLPVDSLV